MACGLEARLPSAEIRRLWNELRVLNETLSDCVQTAEEYLRSLDVRVAGTKAYFVDVRRRLSQIPSGVTIMTEELDKLLGQDEEQTQAYFSRMKSEATNGFEMVSKERSVWMEETTEVMRRQMRVLDNIDIRLLRHAEILRLRATVLKTFQDIINVEEEVKNLQKVLYHCELGKAELEEDFVGLVKTYQELSGTIEEGKPLSEKDTKLQSRDVTDPPLP